MVATHGTVTLLAPWTAPHRGTVLVGRIGRPPTRAHPIPGPTLPPPYQRRKLITRR